MNALWDAYYKELNEKTKQLKEDITRTYEEIARIHRDALKGIKDSDYIRVEIDPAVKELINKKHCEYLEKEIADAIDFAISIIEKKCEVDNLFKELSEIKENKS